MFGIEIFFNGQSKNALNSIFLRVVGKATLLNDLQLLKVCASIFSSPSGKAIDFSLGQHENALLPIFLTFLPIITSSRLGKQLNALS